MDAATSTQSASSAAWSQLQVQQAQRNATQAESKAKSLAVEARNAEKEAVRAQRNAQDLRSQSRQADGEASAAKRGLVQLDSLQRTQTQLSDLRSQIGEALQTLDNASATRSAPVVNVYGQQTGTVVNVTA